MTSETLDAEGRPNELVLQTRRLRLAARAWGPEGGTRVIALHGWLDNAGSFDRLAPLLPELRLVALDFPGHGRSAHQPAGAAYHFIDLVGDVLGAAEALGWERFGLLGHSMGGAVASLVAGAFPDRVTRCAFLEALGPLTTPPEEAPRQLREAMLAPRGENGGAHALPDVGAAADRMRAHHPERTSAAALALASRGTERCAGGVRFSHDLRLRRPSSLRLTEEQVLAFLEGIECPVLVIRAKDGYSTAGIETRRRLAAIAAARLVSVEGGHHVHLDHPERVAAALRRFFRPAAPRGA